MNRKKSVFRWILIPFSLLYGLIVSIRNTLFDLKILPSTDFTTPVISVGNITVGGTGKTPHVEYLVKLLQDEFRIAVLSRGYKRKARGFILSNRESTVDEIGDEPLQIKRRFPNIDVAVDKNRVNGIKRLIADAGHKIIILDDAFQHRYVDPGLSILLIDFNRPMDEDFLMPLGTLREGFHEKRRAHVVLITKTPRDIKPIEQRIIVKNLKLFPYQTLYFTCMKYGNLKRVFKGFEEISQMEELRDRNYSVILLTGIARSKHLYDYIREYVTDITHMEYPDHYQFRKKDLLLLSKQFNNIKNEHKIIITTEKDSMRLLDDTTLDETVKASIYYIPLDIDFLNNDKQDFDRQILKFARKDKTSMNLVISKKKTNFN